MMNNIRLHRTISTVLRQSTCRLSKKPDNTNIVPAKFRDKSYNPNDVKISDLKWRTAWHEKKGAELSMLRSLAYEKSQMSSMQMFYQDFDLSISGIRKWLQKRKERKETFMQNYSSTRNRVLGNELAAAHFILHRGGAVKFHQKHFWIKADENEDINLPVRYKYNLVIQGIDCGNTDIRYEGLETLRALKNVEWLSLRGCPYVDDWFIDKISNIVSHSLLYLDLRDCLKVTDRGLGALYKMPHLKILVLDDIWKGTIYEMVSLLLEEVNPDLEIRGVKETFLL